MKCKILVGLVCFLSFADDDDVFYCWKLSCFVGGTTPPPPHTYYYIQTENLPENSECGKIHLVRQQAKLAGYLSSLQLISSTLLRLKFKLHNHHKTTIEISDPSDPSIEKNIRSTQHEKKISLQKKRFFFYLCTKKQRKVLNKTKIINIKMKGLTIFNTLVFTTNFINPINAFAPVQINHGTTTSSSSPSSSALPMSSSSSNSNNVKVMVNGMPGPMATAAAEACLRKGLQLSPMAMTGPDVEPATITVVDEVTGNYANVRLIPSSNMDEINASIEGLRSTLGEDGSLLAIDYTHPSAVNSNAKFYAEKNIPFVMGTTGGDRDQLMKDMEDAKASAVIAPNMGKQIVAMQAALEELAEKYPSAFEGYTLHTRESHQKTKADTSGTAKAVVDSIKILAGDDQYTYDDIELIRDDQESIDFGVKEEALKGHAFHTYTLTSPDGSVEFQLKHNVSGRNVYAEGSADAVKFLSKKIKEGLGGKIYNMINVLEEGAME